MGIYDVVPFKVVTELTAEVNYGGRVTDNWDRRTIKNVLYDFVNADVLRDGYGFSPSGVYKTAPRHARGRGRRSGRRRRFRAATPCSRHRCWRRLRRRL